MRLITIIIGALLCAVLSGCGPGQAAGGDAPARPPAAVSVEPAVTPSPTPMDAGQVLRALRAAGAPITGIVVFTKQTDPNGRMGHPGSYISKAACVDPRVPAHLVQGKPKGDIEYGCGVEVFAAHEDAQTRSRVIRGIQREMGGLLAGERHIIKGPVLLRVTAHLSKAQTKVYEEALAKVPV